MQRGAVTPSGESTIIEFNGLLLYLSENSPNHISIYFEELTKNLRHQIINYELSKVNYKTVVSSLRGQHPNILKAFLEKNSDEIFVMRIQVTYEFLPQIQEAIIFEKRELSEEQGKQSSVKTMQGHLWNIKKQISEISSLQVSTCEISQNHEQYVKIPHAKCLVTWTLHFHKPTGNIVKLQMYYVNSATKGKKSSNVIPEQGLYLHHSGAEATMEVRFYVETKQQFDQILLSLDGKWKGKSIVAIEKA